MGAALLSCQVFYKELGQLAQNRELVVEFLPQGLHDLPRGQMQEEIQKRIDVLEEEGLYDTIFLGFGFCGGGVEGLYTRRANLILPLVHDCISLLLGRRDLEEMKTQRTFFLSRGWIDCGGDCYKEYQAMTGNLDQLMARFKEYQKEEGALVDWFNKGRYQKKNRRLFHREMAEYVSYECMKNYKEIALIDTGYLTPFHHQYTQEVVAFVDSLLQKYGEEGVERKNIQGHPRLLQRLLSSAQEDLLLCPPGTPLSLKGLI